MKTSNLFLKKQKLNNPLPVLLQILDLYLAGINHRISETYVAYPHTSSKLSLEVAVPKKEKKKKEETTEEVVPKEASELLKGKAQELLNTAAEARKKSISLSQVQYAGELSAQLLELAESMEKLFKTAQACLSNSANDSICNKLVKKMLEKEEFWDKAKAGEGGNFNIKIRFDIYIYIDHFQFPFGVVFPSLSSLHFTSLPFTSLHFPSLPFPSLHFTSPHLTSPHFTSLHFTSLS